jgi:hypothetical protein
MIRSRFKFLSVLVALTLGVLLSPAASAETVTIDLGNAPGGTHLVTGTPSPTCQVTGLTVQCPRLAFEFAGVGHVNATATLSATYSAIIDCFNPGDPSNRNNPIESHTQSLSTSTSSGLLSPKNGRLTINPLVSNVSTGDFLASASCPNPNWEARVRPGSIQLVSYSYTVTFVGFSAPAITITGP